LGIPGIFLKARFTWYFNILMLILQNVFSFDVDSDFFLGSLGALGLVIELRLPITQKVLEI
jgi:hypothetical protein